MTTRIAISGLVLVALGAGAGAGVAVAAGDPAFTTVRTLEGYTATDLTSPGAGRLAVGGLTSTGTAVVETLSSGTWTRQDLGVQADSVRLASTADGTVWALAATKPARPPEYPTNPISSTLWRSTGGQAFQQVPLPTPPSDMTGFKAKYLSAEGNSIVIAAETQTIPTLSNGSTPRAEAVAGVLKDGTWSFTRTANTAGFGTSPAGLVALTQGAPMVEGYRTNTGSSTVTDLYGLGATPGNLLVNGVSSLSGGSLNQPADWTVRGPKDFTLWGAKGTFTPGPVSTSVGSCQKFSGATPMTSCPAPAWPVAKVASLSDGRTLLGGRDWTFDQRIEGGYAIAGPDGALTPVSGDPGDGVRAITTEPGSTSAWALVTTGSVSSIQHADLPASAPTTTPAPTPTVTTTPTTTPAPTTTAPAPTPTPTRTKKPKHPNPWPFPTLPPRPHFFTIAARTI